MSAASGTYRGTPKGRSQLPFADSPSAIPRPKLETIASTSAQSEMSGTSTMSASRQKQSKRDEVRYNTRLDSCIPT